MVWGWGGPVMTPLLILLTALGFGAGDFLAGLASKKVSALTVSLYSQGVAIGLATLAVIFLGGAADPAAVGWGLAAGIAVGLGIVRYYHGLTHGAMGWVATVMGAFSALVPLVVGIALGERPSLVAVAGVLSIVFALFLAIRRNGRAKRGEAAMDAHSLRLPRRQVTGIADGAVAGTCFGFSFVFLGLASSGGPLWPVLMTLAGSIPPILFFRFRNGNRHVEAKGVWPLIVAVGLCQGLAFTAFALAVADGYISIVSVAGALSPVATSLLAFMVLCERLTRRQAVAVGVAIAGIICLILG